ncbi:MAG: DUF4157 domain-containing protein [Deltaproteobacteria bacterium]|nr:DUF4157 domain-containing protein [Deltaproteobacteria bacterium]
MSAPLRERTPRKAARARASSLEEIPLPKARDRFRPTSSEADPASRVARQVQEAVGNRALRDGLAGAPADGVLAASVDALQLGIAGVDAREFTPGTASLRAMREHMEAGPDLSDGGLVDEPETVRSARHMAGRPLPPAVRFRMERAFGHDFSHVGIHTGPTAAEAAESLEARAFTMGDQVFFGRGAWDPDSPEGRELLAHELQHVVQDDQHRLPAPAQDGLDVSSPSDAFEQEARDTAIRLGRADVEDDEIPAWASETSIEGDVAALQGAVGGEAASAARDEEPATLTGEPRRQSGTAAGAPSLASGRQVDDAGRPHDPPTGEWPETQDVHKRVEILHDLGNPLSMEAGQVPQESDLFTTLEGEEGEQVSTEVEPTVDWEDEGVTEITRQTGTVEDPISYTEPVEDALFIGAPDAADVRQGGIGDCYFLAVVLGIIARDPTVFSDGMDRTDGSVSMRFFYKDPADDHWKPVTVTTDDTLPTVADSEGAATDDLVAAGFRVADAPVQTEWSASITLDWLYVERSEQYEAALWAPYLEKTYARFAEEYGQYGDGSASEQSGYDVIDQGGASQACYPMFYGDAVEATGTQDTTFRPGMDIVSDNIPAIRRLLLLENPRPGQQEFLQARIGSQGAVTRMKAQSEYILTLDTLSLAAEMVFFGAIPWVGEGMASERAQEAARSGALALHADLRALNALVTTWEEADSDAARDTALEPVVTKAREVQEPGRHPLLHVPDSDKKYHDLNELLGEVINLGSDSGPGRRMLYAAHAYNVLSVTLTGRAGEPLAITPDEVAAQAGQIDPTRSTVVMQNPHAGNEPDLEGRGPSDRVNEGRFTLTLDQFLRNVDLLRFATVESESAGLVGDFPEANPDVGVA